MCYDLNPLTSIDLIPNPQESKVSFKGEAKVGEMKKLQEQVVAQIEKVNKQYKLKANKNHTHLKFKQPDHVGFH